MIQPFRAVLPRFGNEPNRPDDSGRTQPGTRGTETVYLPNQGRVQITRDSSGQVTKVTPVPVTSD